MSYMTHQALFSGLLNLLFFPYFATCVSANLFSSSSRSFQVQSCGNSGNLHVTGIQENQAQSTSNQHLSTEATISIVALIAAVLIVPIISMYCTYWIAQQYRQSRTNRTNNVSGVTSRNQDQPHAIRATPPIPLVDTVANVAEDLEAPSSAHLRHPGSSSPIIAVQLSGQLRDAPIHTTDQQQTADAEDTTYELEDTSVVLETVPHQGGEVPSNVGGSA
ncbi:hypothetical protein F4679DRAFT_199809 [Xylaria curta]|nr:hypothetical protein F4679DRAFT_199809 [Xylaria curta]